jgi:hypothetical protein
MSSTRQLARRYAVLMMSAIVEACDRFPSISKSPSYKRFRGGVYMDRLRLGIPSPTAWRLDAVNFRREQARYLETRLGPGYHYWPDTVTISNVNGQPRWNLDYNKPEQVGFYVDIIGSDGRRLELRSVFRPGVLLAALDDAKLTGSRGGRDRDETYEGIDPQTGSPSKWNMFRET